MLTSLFVTLLGLALSSAQTVDPGRKAFEARCARCHGADGNGGEIGPAIVLRLAAYDDQQLAGFIRNGLPARGMPPSGGSGAEINHLLKFLRKMPSRAAARFVVSRKVR